MLFLLHLRQPENNSNGKSKVNQFYSTSAPWHGGDY
jgi:hypothetical protein